VRDDGHTRKIKPAIGVRYGIPGGKRDVIGSSETEILKKLRNMYINPGIAQDF
jgi:hypothetical protein